VKDKPGNKTAPIRKALDGRALTLEELQPLVERQLKQIVNKQKLYTLLSVMQTSGRIISVGRGDLRKYVLVPVKAKVAA
jgi:hypothetical protein